MFQVSGKYHCRVVSYRGFCACQELTGVLANRESIVSKQQTRCAGIYFGRVRLGLSSKHKLVSFRRNP